MRIFTSLKELVASYEGPLVPHIDIEGKYDLWSEKPVVIAGRERSEVFFASLIIQSSYVGFYFMPVYTDTSLEEVFSQRLLACKKGKSCFHIREDDKELLEDVLKALRIGYELYEKRGWV